MTDDELRNDIAVVGMSGAFPGAQNIDEFWNGLLAGRSGIIDLSDEDCAAAGIAHQQYTDPAYVKRAAYLEGAKRFDAEFFGISDAEAEILDPQHRIFLQHAWAALESACYIPDAVPGLVGVYASCGLNRYLLNKLFLDTYQFSVEDFQKMLASDKDFLATRASFKLNLKGPSITVQSGCSSSLVAVQLGCTALQTYQCDLALCGGVTLNVPHKAGYSFTDGLIFSPDGECRPFSSAANGTVFGEGVGVVALKRLADAIEDRDNILAVVRGAAINNDGNAKVGFTAPSVHGQSEVIALAQGLADVSPKDIQFVETHGTGTKLGDPIEIAALKEAFGEAGTNFCALGAVKANIGHLDAAAGIAAFIKTVLVARYKCIPPALYTESLNPELGLDKSPFYFNSSPVDLSKQSEPVIAGVSSFGVGGTNAHVIVASPPATSKMHTKLQAHHCVVSAKTKAATVRYQQAVERFAKLHPEQLPELAYTLKQCRKRFNYCAHVTLSSANAPVSALLSEVYRQDMQPKLAFLFSGQGMQFSGMARDLYNSCEHFRLCIDQCLEIFASVSEFELHSLLLEPELESDNSSLINQTEYTQPALFITEYALAQSLIAQGIRPSILIGHSLGEYVAACIAGVMSLEDAIKLVHVRGQLMQTCESGAMLAVFAGAQKVESLLPSELEISLINSPNNTVVSGTLDAIEHFKSKLDSKQIEYRSLLVSRAFHSRFMDTILEKFKVVLDEIEMSKPLFPIVSMCGQYQGIDAPVWLSEYWLEHLRQPVNFVQGVNTLCASDVDVHIEIGPGNGLHSLIAANPTLPSNVQTIISIPRKNDSGLQRGMKELLLDLWSAGVDVDLNPLVPEANLTAVPTYPFEGREYWLPDVSRAGIKHASPMAMNETSNTVHETIAQCWRQVFGKETIDGAANFIELGGDSLLGVRLANQISARLKMAVNISTIMRYPTIDTLSDYLADEKKDEQHFGTLFPIDKRGSGDPIFLISGAHEDRYFMEGRSSYEEDAYRYFSSLVKNLGGLRPVYGFRPRGIFQDEEFHPSVEAMAAEYIEQVKSLQPEGPYILGGECVGGVVAYEMVRQMELAGDEVKSLILMDTHFPTTTFHIMETTRVKLRRGKQRCLALLKTLRSEGIESFLNEALTSLVYLSVFLFPFSKKRHSLRNALFGSQIYLNLLLRYRPRALKTPVHLLVNEEWWQQNQTLDWHKLVGGDVEITAVPGDHKTRLTTHGSELGEVINRLIQ